MKRQTFGRSAGETTIRALLGLTIAGIFIYWSAVFGQLVTVEPLVPGYLDWYLAFPLADLWIASAAIVSLLALRRDERVASVFLGATGSALIFLGLNALLYGYRTGLLFTLTPGEMVEIVIKAYCLAVGTLFIVAAARSGTAAS